jgi:hypothetical protein
MDRTRAAKALDLTHTIGERGPRTYQARKRIAEALDTYGRIRREDVRWLESLLSRA